VSETLNMSIMYHKHCMNKQYFIFLSLECNKGADSALEPDGQSGRKIRQD